MYSGMFHLPGCRAAFHGKRGWVVPIFLTAIATSGCTAWVFCALLFLWSNIAEVKRISRRKPRPEAIRQLVSTGLLRQNNLGARQEQFARAIELAGLKIDLFLNRKSY